MKIIFLFLTIFVFLIGCNTSRNYEEHKRKDNTFDSFIFVGMINNNPGIYKYDLPGGQAGFNQEKYFFIWNDKKENVVELSYSTSRKFAFFITASSKGKKGVFPFINDVKIYLINPDSEKVKFLSEIGSGMQVFTGWESDSTFKITLNSFDKINVNQINQRALVFNILGENLLDETKTYDIEKDGYPKPLPNNKSLITNSDYKIISSDDSLTSIFLVGKSEQDTLLITNVDQKLNEFKFTSDGKYLIFSTLDMTPSNETIYDENPNTSKLFIYSIEDKTIKKVFEGGGVKNFFIVNNLVIFDDGFREKSNIKIYDILNLKLIKKISIKGGCGLRNIPELPDYSA